MSNVAVSAESIVSTRHWPRLLWIQPIRVTYRCPLGKAVPQLALDSCIRSMKDYGNRGKSEIRNVFIVTSTRYVQSNLKPKCIQYPAIHTNYNF